MAKRKRKGPGRMFSREQRRANRQQQLERAAAMTPQDIQAAIAEQDLAFLTDALPGVANQPYRLAEVWLGIEADGDSRDAADHDLQGKLARRYKRLTGQRLTREQAEAEIAAAEDQADARQEADWWEHATDEDLETRFGGGT